MFSSRKFFFDSKALSINIEVKHNVNLSILPRFFLSVQLLNVQIWHNLFTKRIFQDFLTSSTSIDDDEKWYFLKRDWKKTLCAYKRIELKMRSQKWKFSREFVCFFLGINHKFFFCLLSFLLQMPRGLT